MSKGVRTFQNLVILAREVKEEENKEPKLKQTLGIEDIAKKPQGSEKPSIGYLSAGEFEKTVENNRAANYNNLNASNLSQRDRLCEREREEYSYALYNNSGGEKGKS